THNAMGFGVRNFVGICNSINPTIKLILGQIQWVLRSNLSLPACFENPGILASWPSATNTLPTTINIFAVVCNPQRDGFWVRNLAGVRGSVKSTIELILARIPTGSVWMGIHRTI